jgi:hypothetical protein
VSVRVEHQRPPAPCWREDELVGSSPDAALDRSQERHPAIATGLTILDASDTPAGFLYIVLVGTIFRDKPNKLLWSPVRSQQASPETAPFESGFSESLVQVASIYSRYSLSASSSLLPGDKLVRSSEEDLRWKVPAQLAAQGGTRR